MRKVIEPNPVLAILEKENSSNGSLARQAWKIDKDRMKFSDLTVDSLTCEKN